MAGYTFPQLRQLATNAGFTGSAADTISAIALAESSGNPGAINYSDPGGSYGLTQINQAAHPGTATQALDPQGSFDLAYGISRGGTNFSPWSTYTTSNPSISYAQYLPSSSSGSGPAMSIDAPGFVPGGGTATTLQPGEADYGGGPGSPTGNQSVYPGGTGSGDPMLPPTIGADPGNPLPNVGGGAAAAAGLQAIGAFGSNWLIRGALIALGVLLTAVAAYALAHGELPGPEQAASLARKVPIVPG